MEEFADKMADKVGIDRATADKVIEFLRTRRRRSRCSDSGVADRLPGGIGLGMF
jgi:hypothetical protein